MKTRIEVSVQVGTEGEGEKGEGSPDTLVGHVSLLC